MGNESLVIRFVVKKMHLLRVIPTIFGFLGITYRVVGHHFQALGIGHFFGEQVIGAAVAEVGWLLTTRQLALQNSADAARFLVGRWCGGFVIGAVFVKRGVTQ
ncbi:hypothetical protein D3C76_1496110 [compost metagenome]